MFRKLTWATLSIALLTAPTVSLAAPCRGANGKFIRCASTAPVKATRCKNAKGRFAKCGTAGAKAI